MAKDRELITAVVIEGHTGEVLATGEVGGCCAPHFVDDVYGLVVEARERMQEGLSDDSDGDRGSGSVMVGFTADYGAGWDRIWGNKGVVGEA